MDPNAPPHVQDALHSQRPDFLVRSRFAARRRHVATMALLLAAFALVASLPGLASLAGNGAMTTGDGREVAGPERLVWGVALLAGALGFMSLIAYLTLRPLLLPGPWIAATAEGVHVFAGEAPQLHPWTRFDGARREGNDVILRTVPGQPIPVGRRSRTRDLAIVEPDDPERVLQACLARLRAAGMVDDRDLVRPPG